MSEPGLILDTDQALADLRELRKLAVAQKFDLFEFLRLLEEGGEPLFQINKTTTVETGDLLVNYKLADEALVCLSTLRARNIRAVDIESRPSHSPSLPVDGQLTPNSRKPPHGATYE